MPQTIESNALSLRSEYPGVTAHPPSGTRGRRLGDGGLYVQSFFRQELRLNTSRE